MLNFLYIFFLLCPAEPALRIMLKEEIGGDTDETSPIQGLLNF